MLRRILCPTDFSDFSTAAFAESVRLARWFGAKVIVVNVMAPAVPIGREVGYVPLSVEEDEALRAAKLQEIRRFIEATPHAGVHVEAMVLDGIAARRIRSAVHDTKADLVVMGTHGRSGLTRLAMGSVTEAVLRDPPAPVLTVHRNLAHRRGLYRRILCATDVSEHTTGTLAVAMALADEGAKRLTVLHVIEDGRESPRGELEQAALEALRTLIPDEARVSYSVEEHVAFGQAEREIVRIAGQEEADLVVMGGHRHSVLGDMFGATVRGVVRESPCPVLLVPTGHAWAAAPAERTRREEKTHGTSSRTRSDYQR